MKNSGTESEQHHLGSDAKLRPFEIHIIKSGHLPGIKALTKSPRLQLTDNNGNTALHLSSQHGRTEACAILIEAGINLYAVNNNGLTALDIASQSGNEYIVDLIKQALGLSLKSSTQDDGDSFENNKTDKTTRITEIKSHDANNTLTGIGENIEVIAYSDVDSDTEFDIDLEIDWDLDPIYDEEYEEVSNNSVMPRPNIVSGHPKTPVSKTLTVDNYNLRKFEKKNLEQSSKNHKSNEESKSAKAETSCDIEAAAPDVSTEKIHPELASELQVYDVANNILEPDKTPDNTSESRNAHSNHTQPKSYFETGEPEDILELLGISNEIETSLSPNSKFDLNFEEVVTAEEFIKTSPIKEASFEFTPIEVCSLEPDDAIIWDASGIVPTSRNYLEHLITDESNEETDQEKQQKSESSLEHDYLAAQRGKRSTRQNKITPNAKVWIDYNTCLKWASDCYEFEQITISDIEALVCQCSGSEDPNELIINIASTLEANGFSLYEENINTVLFGKFSNWPNISAEEVAESVHATLNRNVELPGLQKFEMKQSRDAKLLEPLITCKQELHLNLLKSTRAVNTLLSLVNKTILEQSGNQNISLKTLNFKSKSKDTEDFKNAFETLREWVNSGSITHGKKRRMALEALEDLDLNPNVYDQIIDTICINNAANDLDNHYSFFDLRNSIANYEREIRKLIQRHLPYARRFAARNTEENEEVEDIFQWAVIGLERATRRFNPLLEIRFTIYCTFWMYQTVTRARMDNDALIRVPVHRNILMGKVKPHIENHDSFYKTADNLALLMKNLALENNTTEEDIIRLSKIPSKEVTINQLEDEPPEELIDYISPEDICSIDSRNRLLRNILKNLDDRAYEVLALRFGLGEEDEMTLEQVGKIFNVTRERIRQIEAKAIKRLQHPVFSSILESAKE